MVTNNFARRKIETVLTFDAAFAKLLWLLVCCSGNPCKFVVVTTGSGSGTLSVMVEGPAKVAIVCTEVDEGYEFSYTPTAPGDYLIAIKYCNVTIAGCPHKAVVSGN